MEWKERMWSLDKSRNNGRENGTTEEVRGQIQEEVEYEYYKEETNDEQKVGSRKKRGRIEKQE